MSHAIVARPEYSPSISPGTPTEHELAVFNTMAKQAVDSKMYGRFDQAAVMTIMLSARELGMPPMQALNGGLTIIQGKMEISARMMNAMIRRAGHSIITIESTDESCTVKGVRSDNGDVAIVSYTIAEAHKAGLVKVGGGWTRNPKDMCYARAISRLARQLFADVIGMGYVEGEISRPTEAPVEHETPKQYLKSDFLSLFGDDDVLLASQYFDELCAHFGWLNDVGADRLMRDTDKSMQAFNAWKQKTKATNA